MSLNLPLSVCKTLEELSSPFKKGELQRASRSLTRAYRTDQNSKELFLDPAHRIAYLVTRLPATYGCLAQVLASLPNIHESLLDLGAGPATVYGALKGMGRALKSAIFYEQSAPLFKDGMSLWSNLGPESSVADLVTTPLSTTTLLPRADLVTLGFFLGELSSKLAEEILLKAWAVCTKTLVIVEPGTPARFERLRQYRKILIEQGAHVGAPCPHAFSCPMQGGDWCHFSAKVDRSFLHRQMKGVSHPFEFEKYTYLVVSKNPEGSKAYGRILRAPLKKSGHVVLDLCTAKGLRQHTVSKKEGDIYREVKKKEWGDCVDFI